MSDYPIPSKSTASVDTPHINVADIPFSDDLAQKAFTHILSIIKGNGLSPQKVTLLKMEGHVYELYGALHLKLEPQITRKKGGQAASGENITAGQLDSKIEQVMQDLGYDDTIKQAVFRDITQSKHKGFGLQGGQIALPVTKTFIESEQCGQCRGQGRSPCPQCQGSGQMPCQSCRGSRLSPCIMCRGTGRKQTAGAGNDLFTYCKGQGQMPCDMCRSAGYMPCTSCGTSGAIACPACRATGKISHISDVAFTLKPAFELGERGLAKDLKPFLAQSLAELAAAQEIDVHQLSQEETERLTKQRILPPAMQQDFAYLGYRALCPHARLHISLAGKKSFQVQIAGYAGRIVACDPFLDVLMNKPLKLLQKGAAESRIAAGNIAKAARWKTARTAIIAGIKASPKKAQALLLKNTPLGLSEKYAKALTFYAFKAVQQVTKWPRYMALSAGSLLNLVLYVVWFNTERFGLFNTLSLPPAIPDIWLKIAADLSAAGLLALLCIVVIRFSAYIALKKTLGSLGLDKDAKSWTKAGEVGFYSWAIQLPLLFLAAVLLAEKKPEWLGLLGL